MAKSALPPTDYFQRPVSAKVVKRWCVPFLSLHAHADATIEPNRGKYRRGGTSVETGLPGLAGGFAVSTDTHALLRDCSLAESDQS
jgi:hypothetical protein